jgi:hypothetical protein
VVPAGDTELLPDPVAPATPWSTNAASRSPGAVDQESVEPADGQTGEAESVVPGVAAADVESTLTKLPGSTTRLWLPVEPATRPFLGVGLCAAPLSSAADPDQPWTSQVSGVVRSVAATRCDGAEISLPSTGEVWVDW